MRSILSLVVGYLVLAVVVIVGFGLLGGERPAISVGVVFVAAWAAGVVAARVAPSRGRGHAVFLGVLVSAVGFAALLFGSVEAAETPLWARLAMALAPIPAASLGGRLGDRTPDFTG